MSRQLKIKWSIWAVSVLVVAIGTLAFWVSSETDNIPVVLANNNEASVSVFRLRPANLILSLEFKAKGKGERPELGGWASRGDPWKTGVLHKPEPGEPVLIKVRIVERDEATVYEALPADSIGAGRIWRSLVPYIDDGDPQRFRWPPSYVKLPSGTSHIEVSVMEVGKRISGEQVVLSIEPPLTFKTVMPGYQVLWWFGLWPVYLGVLAIIAGVFFWQGKKERCALHGGAVGT